MQAKRGKSSALSYYHVVLHELHWAKKLPGKKPINNSHRTTELKSIHIASLQFVPKLHLNSFWRLYTFFQLLLGEYFGSLEFGTVLLLVTVLFIYSDRNRLKI